MRTDNVLTGARRTNPPYIEVKPGQLGFKQLANLANLWQRSWLYQSPVTGMVRLAADESGDDYELIAVLGPVTAREIRTFLS